MINAAFSYRRQYRSKAFGRGQISQPKSTFAAIQFVDFPLFNLLILSNAKIQNLIVRL